MLETGDLARPEPISRACSRVGYIGFVRLSRSLIQDFRPQANLSLFCAAIRIRHISSK
jgi:hypothetical protein